MLRTLILWTYCCGLLSAQVTVGVAVDCVEGSVWQGQPAIFGIHLFAAVLGEPSVESGAITLQIRKASGESAEWPLKPLTRIAFPLQLKPMQMASEYWALNSDESATLEAGDYIAEARLDAVVSRRFRFKVLAVDDVNAGPLLRLRINYLRLTGDAAGAGALIEEAIVRQPQDINLLYLLAMAQQEAGNLKAALTTIERALDLFKQLFPDAEHPPLEYIRLRSKLDWGIE